MNSHLFKQKDWSRKLRVQSAICVVLYLLILAIQAIKYPIFESLTKELGYQINQPFSFSETATRLWTWAEGVPDTFLSATESLTVFQPNEWSFVYPVKGQVKAAYQEENPFSEGLLNGLLFEGEEGEAVVAGEAGVVVEMKTNQAMGNYIILKHRGEMLSIYKHLESSVVALNEKVQQGQVIGSSSEKLIFEIWIEKQPVDPYDFLSTGGL